jgi:hypothetical protein
MVLQKNPMYLPAKIWMLSMMQLQFETPKHQVSLISLVTFLRPGKSSFRSFTQEVQGERRNPKETGSLSGDIHQRTRAKE